MGGAGESTLGEARAGRCERSHSVTGTEREEWLGTMRDLGRQPAFGQVVAVARAMRRAVRRQPEKAVTLAKAQAACGVSSALKGSAAWAERLTATLVERSIALRAQQRGTGNSESSARDMRKQGMHGPSSGGQEGG
ncbi:hypothetical protein ERJ75_000817700 [Trypanosoma vivax]|nr:hypothetical protein ERJ75_000817700 [Trypanosoma vivax]